MSIDDSPPTALVAQQAGPPRLLDDGAEVALLPGEELVAEGTPMRSKLLRYIMVISALVSVPVGIGLLFLPLIYLIARAFVGKHRYWLTTSRVNRDEWDHWFSNA